jgi:hypothetical protein
MRPFVNPRVSIDQIRQNIARSLAELRWTIEASIATMEESRAALRYADEILQRSHRMRLEQPGKSQRRTDTNAPHPS